MTQTTKPNVFAAIRYQDCPAAIEWLGRAFGLEKHVVFDSPDGTIGHGELRYGPSVLVVSSVGPVDPANPWTAVSQGVYVRVDDIAAHYARAQAAGADIAISLRDTSYGSREYSARDMEGRLWSFGTYDMGAAPGAPTMFPALQYRDGDAALAWLDKAFGFETTLRIPGPHGSLVHAEMRFENGVIMVESAPDASGLWGDQTQSLCLCVDEPDAHFDRASAAGATIVRGIENTSYGARGYVAKDLEGFLWAVSTYKPAMEGEKSEVK